MSPATLLPWGLYFLATMVLAHRPHLDNGLHNSIASAWEFPDTTIARVFLAYFDCPSTATYTSVNITDPSAPLAVGIGIPNITALHDYRPSLWAIGANAVTPENYGKSGDGSEVVLLSPTSAHRPRIPRGFNAVEFPSETVTTIIPFAEKDSAISSFGLLRANVTVSAPGMVYLILQPVEHRRARAYLAIGHDKTKAEEAGEANEGDSDAWFSATSVPRLGTRCEAWTFCHGCLSRDTHIYIRTPNLA